MTKLLSSKVILLNLKVEIYLYDMNTPSNILGVRMTLWKNGRNKVWYFRKENSKKDFCTI